MFVKKRERAAGEGEHEQKGKLVDVHTEPREQLIIELLKFEIFQIAKQYTASTVLTTFFLKCSLLYHCRMSLRLQH